MILSLDVATKTGVASFTAPNLLNTYTIESSPVNLIAALGERYPMLNPVDDIVLIEEFVYYRHVQNPVTTAKLVQRLGYVKYSFIAAGFAVSMIHPGSARKQLGIKGKSKEMKKLIRDTFREQTGFPLSYDQSDAIVLILSHLGCTRLEQISDYSLYRDKNIKVAD